MKTTLVIDDQVMQRLREVSARSGRTISQTVEAALRRMLDPEDQPQPKPEELPSYDLGGARIDISDRDALYQAMEGR